MPVLRSIFRLFKNFFCSTWIRHPFCSLFPPLRLISGFFGENWDSVWLRVSYYATLNGIGFLFLGVVFKVVVGIGFEVSQRISLAALDRFANLSLLTFMGDVVFLFGMLFVARYRDYLKKTDPYDEDHWSLSLFSVWLTKNLKRLWRTLDV